MTEYFLPADQWPRTLPRTHKELLQGIIEKLSAHSDLLGLAIGGSFVLDQMDQFSDLDLKIIANPGEWETVREARKQIAASVGPLVSAFTAEHVGVPQMLICMYGDMLIHVDLHFIVPEQLASRPEDRWCCGTAMERCITSCPAASHVQPRWIGNGSRTDSGRGSTIRRQEPLGGNCLRQFDSCRSCCGRYWDL
jgi:hypothetical protein